LFGGHIQQN